MTEEQLAALEKLAEAATPGPWLDEHHHVLVLTEERNAIGEQIADYFGQFWGRPHDAAFASAARAAVPALVAEVRRLKKDNAQLRKWVDETMPHESLRDGR